MFVKFDNISGSNCAINRIIVALQLTKLDTSVGERLELPVVHGCSLREAFFLSKVKLITRNWWIRRAWRRWLGRGTSLRWFLILENALFCLAIWLFYDHFLIARWLLFVKLYFSTRLLFSSPYLHISRRFLWKCYRWRWFSILIRRTQCRLKASLKNFLGSILPMLSIVVFCLFDQIFAFTPSLGLATHKYQRSYKSAKRDQWI